MTSNGSATAATSTKRVFQRTQLCAFWARGSCKRGTSCAFAHGEDQLRETPDLSKTKICKNFQKGECMLGEGCTFAHRREDLRVLRPKKVIEGKSNVLVEVLRQKPSKARAKGGKVDVMEPENEQPVDSGPESGAGFFMDHSEMYVVEPEKTEDVLQQLLGGSAPANLLFRL